MILQCEICEQQIARTKPDRLRLPLRTTMFDPLTDQHSHPWPWPQGWLEMTCPFCNNRPFVMSEKEIQDSLEGHSEGPSRIKTPNGWFKVGDTLEPGEIPERVVEVHDDEDLADEWDKRTLLKGSGQVVEQMPASDVAIPSEAPKSRRVGRPRKVKS